MTMFKRCATNFCDRCGRPISEYDKYCIVCFQVEAQKDRGIENLLDKATSDSIPDIEQGDRVWFRNPQDTVIERYVHEVKNKVFGVGSKPNPSVYNTYWYEFDNVDIIEVEKDE